MYGICCVPFSLRKTACQKYFFQILSQKETLRQRISKIRIWIWSEESIQSVDFMDPWSGFGFAQKNEKSVFGFGNPDLGFPKKCTLGWVRLGNLDLDFEIWISDLQSNAKSKNGLHLREIRPQNGLKLRNPNPDFVDLLFTVRLGIRKRICKTAVFSLLITRARARPLLLRTVFQILFWISNRMVKNENTKTDISALKSVSDFPLDCKYEIQILKATSRSPNRTHPTSDFGATLARQLIQTAHRVSSLSQDGQKFDRLCRTERFCRTKLKLLYQINLDAALLPFHQLGSSQEWRASEPCIRQTSNRFLNTTHEKCPVGWWSLELTAPIDS